MLRTRFAPSPTGYLHVGGLRTALYNYLFAKKNNGQFLLRIEDTDQTRFVPGAMESLIKILNDLDLKYDEGPDVGGPHAPYIQSQRTTIYLNHVDDLLSKGAAYRCFCSKERLDQMREDQQKHHQAPMYDRHCLSLTKEEIVANLKNKIPFIIRQKISYEKKVEFEDLIRGKVQFDPYTIDDQVLLKSDGFPTYHLANVVDDHLMEITHVIRGEEWLPSTPKHILLYEAFGWQKPKFAHLPLLLNPDKSKLSKRQGDVAVEDYLQKGYLKEALINFIALLGWNPGSGNEQEIFTMQELIAQFSLEKVQKAGAVFNLEKLNWINGKYLRQLSSEELMEKILTYLKKEEWFSDSIDQAYLQKCLELEKDRLTTFAEAPAKLKFFLNEDLKYDLNLFLNEKMKVDKNMAIMALENSLPALEKLENYNDEEVIKNTLLAVISVISEITKIPVKNGQLLWPVRVALTAEPFSPGVFELIKVMGKEKTIKRIKEGLNFLK